MRTSRIWGNLVLLLGLTALQFALTIPGNTEGTSTILSSENPGQAIPATARVLPEDDLSTASLVEFGTLIPSESTVTPAAGNATKVSAQDDDSTSGQRTLPSHLANAVLASESADAAPGTLIVPDTSLEYPEEVGTQSHTNHLFSKPMASGSGTPSGETPQSLRAVYQLPSTGGSGIIAVVIAYHYPTALNDFNVFSKQFGLPQEKSPNPLSSANSVFQVVYATGKQPATNAGWAQEAALDIEWSHAMAPNAKIVLVEAKSNSNADLNQAVQVASKLPGVRQVSMSWGSSEYSTELLNDSIFKSTSVVFFAASGDVGGKTIYPGCSPLVVSAGGTTIKRDSKGLFLGEKGWSGSGGGKSKYEKRPAYQAKLSALVGSSRGVPDCSFVADPQSGVAVYDSTPYYGYSGWMVFGGTSASSPALAGVANLAGSGQPGTTAELNYIYANLGTANYRDILTGTAGSFQAQAGWDFVTGAGSPIGLLGK